MCRFIVNLILKAIYEEQVQLGIYRNFSQPFKTKQRKGFSYF